MQSQIETNNNTMDNTNIKEFDPSEIYSDYQRALEEENERQRSNSDKILAEVDKMVSVEYSKAQVS